VKTLYPQGERETSPSANAVPGSLPKEDGDGSPSDASDCGCEDKHATKSFAWWIDSSKYTEFED
jgi:hypothetical protein